MTVWTNQEIRQKSTAEIMQRMNENLYWYEECWVGQRLHGIIVNKRFMKRLDCEHHRLWKELRRR